MGKEKPMTNELIEKIEIDSSNDTSAISNYWTLPRMTPGATPSQTIIIGVDGKIEKLIINPINWITRPAVTINRPQVEQIWEITEKLPSLSHLISQERDRE